jgi:hypothetical protein
LPDVLLSQKFNRLKALLVRFIFPEIKIGIAIPEMTDFNHFFHRPKIPKVLRKS